MFSLLAAFRLLEDLAEYRRDIAAKLFGIFAHRKMTGLFHDGDAGALDRGSRSFSIFRSAGKIIFAGQEIKRAGAGIDPLDPAAQIAIDPVEMIHRPGADIRSRGYPRAGPMQALDRAAREFRQTRR